MRDSPQYQTGARKANRFRQGLMPLIVMALAVLLLASIALPVLGQEANPNEEQTALPTYASLREESRVFKQEVLTATRSERRLLADAATRLMAQFDLRIERLQDKLDSQKADMSENARRYSEDLMATMQESRMKLEDRLPMLRADAGEDWDHSLYQFSKAYEAFAEAWSDVESNLDPESV